MSGRIITTGVQGGRLGVRQEISTLARDTDLLNLYLLGLEELQAVDQNDPKSWYQLSGIHGRPYAPYDGVGQPGSFGGYCTHSSILFPTWHRPYLALYEQVLQERMRGIAGRFPEAERAKWQAVAERFRIPYWDWAADAGLPDIVARQETIAVNSPTGRRTIPNPLYAYRFHPVPQDFADNLPDERTWEAYRVTLRYPTSTNPNTAANARSQPDRMNAQLNNNRLTLRDRTYNLLTQATNWAAFSNDGFLGPRSSANSYDSLESIHGQIHGLTGANGHMSVVDFAAFDPVFWLHHANVDRLLAIWQAINPRAFVTPRANNAGTFTTRPGTVENETSPLTPFRRNANAFWTSADARDTRSLNYTYPELEQWANLTPEQKSTRLRTTVNQLYGRTAPAASLRTGGASNIPPTPQPQPTPQPPRPAQPQAAQPAQPAQPRAQAQAPVSINPNVAKPPGPTLAKPAAPVPVARTSATSGVATTSAPSAAAAPAARPPQHYEEHLNQELDAYKARHIAYWQERNVYIEVWRYEAGFKKGFHDVAVGPSQLVQRKNEFVAEYGDKLVWEFEHGYNEAYESWRKVAIAVRYDAAFKTHHDGHLSYWKARNTEVEIHRFDDGFKKGWDDAASGPSKVDARKGEHIQRYGDSHHVWQFVHGYNEGMQAYGEAKREAYNPVKALPAQAPQPTQPPQQKEEVAQGDSKQKPLGLWLNKAIETLQTAAAAKAGEIKQGSSSSGQAPNIQQLAKEGQKIFKDVVANLPKAIPGKQIHGHEVRDYYEWIANIRVKKYAVDNTFFVHVFLGDFDPNPEKWSTEPNLVGTHVVFTSKPGTGCAKCISDRERGTEVTGTIPLTGALGDKFGNVYELEPSKIDPYLKKELHWRITKHDGTPIDRQAIPSLKLSVAHTLVDVPDAEDEFPIWGEALLDLAVTAGRPGGANDEDDA